MAGGRGKKVAQWKGGNWVGTGGSVWAWGGGNGWCGVGVG